MKTNKTTETTQSVSDFLNSVTDETKRADSFALVDIMQAQTGFGAKLWGPSLVGFGSYHYQYDSGREGDAPLVGFSPRANALTLYLGTFEGKDELLQKLGKHKTGKGCIYIKTLRDANPETLSELIRRSAQRTISDAVS
ncbi:DUF1801 domain-containing protein [Spirosoma panaciterrae]|uniref:DUF1801 domain-containing protein n=1 Tax=Spirosoma panaciterrae TaxID=496058 RepID=UPI000360A7BC|nr:DUF1801 domain-containing protein [Spirosoma panaciterrae]